MSLHVLQSTANLVKMILTFNYPVSSCSSLLYHCGWILDPSGTDTIISMDEKRSNTQNNKKNISPVLWTDSFQDVSRKVLKKNRKNFSLLSNLEKFITFLPI